MVCEINGADPAILEPLSGPAVAHYCGHRIASSGGEGRFSTADEGVVARMIAAEVARHPVAYAYGSLASGGDILWAEALLATGCELHVILPFDREEFVRHSVAPSGPGWVERLWDGGPAHGEAGTAIDVERWRRAGREASVAWPSAGSLPGPDDPEPAAVSPPAPAQASPAAVSGRVMRAMLFADVRGFSRLTDEQLPRLADRVLGAFADTLSRHSCSIEHQNTWGDGLYVVLADAPAASACVLDLQAAMTGLDLEAEVCRSISPSASAGTSGRSSRPGIRCWGSWPSWAHTSAAPPGSSR